MTGAAEVVRFRGRLRKKPVVELVKPDNVVERREAEKALRESVARKTQAENQRKSVARLATRLAEVRKRNNFAKGIKTAMGGDG